MQEEAGIKFMDVQDGSRPVSSSSNGPGFELHSVLGQKNEDTAAGPRQRAASIPANQPTLNEHLAPGTAAGTTIGPTSDTEEPVDWDLWQSVVYEGPAAVARTSADELSKAIAHGIPSAIRGVVWQVLAQSQSVELETLYRELRNRGEEVKRRTSELKPRPTDVKKDGLGIKANGAVQEEQPSQDTIQEKDSFHSSAASVRSGDSTPSSPTSEGAIGSPVTSQDASSVEGQAMTQALLLAEENKRAKEEAAALTKLEKAIRRDLGARTSYSKFLMSAGLQNGLFGICKAYALYDEDVGYAQGMNFIVMPLLFNVGSPHHLCLGH